MTNAKEQNLSKLTYSAKDYTQDGLVAMFDAIENGQDHIHDPTLTKSTWVEWCGTGWKFDIDREGNMFGDNYFIQTEKRTAYNYSVSTELISLLSNTYTWEAIYGKCVLTDDTNNYQLIGTYGTNPTRNICAYTPSTRKLNDFETIGATYVLPKDNKFIRLVWRLDHQKFTKLYFAQWSSGSAMSEGYYPITLPSSVDYMYSQPVSHQLHCLRFYNRILSDDELTENFKVDKVRFGI